MINVEIKEELEKYKIDYEEGTLILLGIYYNVLPSFITANALMKVFATGIVIKNMDNTYTWKIPLLETQEINFAWVAEYRLAFKKFNQDRAGSLSTCVARMKKFFADNPHVRVEDVRGAVNMYFRTVRDPQYLITSHKFIYDGAGVSRNSHLEEWLEKYKEANGGNVKRVSTTKTMQ